MDNKNLVQRITDMSYEQLLKRIEKIRDARVDAVAASEEKPVRKARPKKTDKDKVKKLADQMSPEERERLIALLEKQS